MQQCGYLTDKVNRVYMLAFIVVAGEAPCLCTYWVSVSLSVVLLVAGWGRGRCPCDTARKWSNAKCIA